MKTYPLVADYKIAVAITDSFATLNTLEPCYVGKDLLFATGGPAVVFKMKDINTRQYSAIKCFIKEFSERSHHFSHISKFIASLPSNPYFVNYTYYDKEIWVNDDEYPVLQMPWIEGKTLSRLSPNYAVREILLPFKSLPINLTKWLCGYLSRIWRMGI